MKIDEVEYVTTMEAVAILGVTQQRVRKMLQDKVLKGRKVGRDWMIEKKAVIERKRGRHNALPLLVTPPYSRTR